jgi:hypothetical protein
MIDIKIRYNTLCDDNRKFWRILINGIEHTASHINIEIPVQTTRDIVFDPNRNEKVNKHHMSCIANEIMWDDDIVTIK